MKRSTFRIVSILLVCLMLLSATACSDGDATEAGSTKSTGSAQQTEAPAQSSDGLEFGLNKDGASYRVKGIGTCTDVDVVIPASYNGKPVTVIGQCAFEDCDSLTSVTIPDSVTVIGTAAFHRCTSLKSVLIPDSVTEIGSRVFEDCDNIQFDVYDNAMYLGNERNPYHILVKASDSNIKSVVIHLQTKVIGDSAFRKCTSLTSVTIPDSVTEVGEDAFRECTGLTSVTIPDSVTVIGDSAFYQCTSLTSVTIPDSVTVIGEYAFGQCTSLTSVTIPESVTVIGEYAFGDCDSLTSVTIPDSVTVIGECAFGYCGSLTNLTIGNGVTEIGKLAFSDCTSLKTVHYRGTKEQWENLFWYFGMYVYDDIRSIDATIIYDNIESSSTPAQPNEAQAQSSEGLKIGQLTNYYLSVIGIGSCTDVNVVIPAKYEGKPVREILRGAFKDCTSLISVTIPDSVYGIGTSAFAGCTSLTSVTIPDSVFEIDTSTFEGCTSLTSVTIPDRVTKIGMSAFKDCTGLTSVTIPESVTEIEFDAFSNCVHLHTVRYRGTEAQWSQITIYSSNDELTDATIICNFTGPSPAPEHSNEGLEFEQNEDGDSYTVSSIGTCADLDVVIPPSYNGKPVTAIGRKAFHACTNLTSVTIPDSVTVIGEYAFGDCHSLTSVTIPDSVTVIGKYAFGGTSLTSVTIPDSVTEIGDFAFNGSKVSRQNTTVNYRGTEEQWSQISIGRGFDKFTIVYNYTGD